jgi:hypothetical protein
MFCWYNKRPEVGNLIKKRGLFISQFLKLKVQDQVALPVWFWQGTHLLHHIMAYGIILRVHGRGQERKPESRVRSVLLFYRNLLFRNLIGVPQ